VDWLQTPVLWWQYIILILFSVAMSIINMANKK
jgi:hypothetical protein